MPTWAHRRVQANGQLGCGGGPKWEECTGSANLGEGQDCTRPPHTLTRPGPSFQSLSALLSPAPPMLLQSNTFLLLPHLLPSRCTCPLPPPGSLLSPYMRGLPGRCSHPALAQDPGLRCSYQMETWYLLGRR